MRDLLRVDLGDGRRAVFRHSTKLDGDLSPSSVDPDRLTARRAGLAPVDRWHTVRQVHGNTTVEVASVDPPCLRPTADALVTTRSGCAIAVHVADCVPIGLAHLGGGAAVVHAGWRGLEAGVVESATRTLRAAVGRDQPVVAVIGPHIRVDRYEFGRDELARLVDRFGHAVAGRTAIGTPALDLTEAARRSLTDSDVEVVHESPDCTAARADSYWSHRARNERGRMALVAWLEPA